MTTALNQLSLMIVLLLCCHCIQQMPMTLAFSSTTTSGQAQTQTPIKVLVTGAAGKTGRLVLKKLEHDARYEPKGLVRTERSAVRLIKNKDIHCPLEHMVISDITSPTFFEDNNNNNNYNGLQGMDAMIICTSAVPRISRKSLLGAVLKAPWNMLRRKGYAIDFRTLQFKWKHNGYPELVDYHGQVAQIDLAKKLGIDHVVIVSSMGGTDPDNFLNSVGKRHDGSGNGDILLWKRKAEKYLVESGLEYTILHPGGLNDSPGGIEEFVLDVDDHSKKEHSRTCISREDLAELCVAALSVDVVAASNNNKNDIGKGNSSGSKMGGYGYGGGQGQRQKPLRNHNVSFDCITRPIIITDDNDNEHDEHNASGNANCNNANANAQPKSAEEALQQFLEQSKTANYAL